MSISAHLFPTFLSSIADKSYNLNGVDSVYCLLVGSGNYLGGTAGALNATVEAMTTLASIKANGASAITEVSGTGYTTNGLLLTGVAVSQATLYTSVTCSGAIQWTNATFTAYQAVFYINNGTTTQGICYWDFGGGQSCSSGTFTLTLGSANGVSNVIAQITAS